jgi:uncharacterized protein
MTGATRTRPAPVYDPTSQVAPAASSAPVVRPLGAAERLAFVDAVRGIAILGVLVAYTMWNLGGPPEAAWSGADRIIDPTLSTLVDAKFVTIFACLFGVGTAQQWRRFEAAGRDPWTLHVRRMLFLLTVGLLHATLLRNGDILAPYAILGLVLFVVHRWPARRIAIAAVVLAVAPYAIGALRHSLGLSLPPRPTSGADDRAWIGYWTDNLAWVRYWYRTGPYTDWPRLLALMLAGVLADRARVPQRLATDARLARRVLAVALPLAVLTRVAVSALPTLWTPDHAPFARGIVLTQTFYFSAWTLAAVYVAALALLCQRPGWPARLSWLRAVGRMAFTNYLVQAIVIVPICIHYALFDAVTPTRGALLALGVAAIQIPLSVLWLRRAPYGPVEHAWRRVTYGPTTRA